MVQLGALIIYNMPKMPNLEILYILQRPLLNKQFGTDSTIGKTTTL